MVIYNLYLNPRKFRLHLLFEDNIILWNLCYKY